ncbi:MAG: hypothetical protein HFG54_09280 [Lachnospiraceae bacterium]|jgi:hypothetical protein|nr:hypothetical protein [Lachnospiraceae bacterium]
MSEIFNEENMRRMLGESVPEGETLVAGIHAIAQVMCIKGIYGKCVRYEDRLSPDERGGIIALSKEKYSSNDIYIGITSHFLVIVGCERNAYFYQYEDAPKAAEEDVLEVTSDIFLKDIGTCYLLTDIQRCEMKKGWMGSVKCWLTMKNGSCFKLLFPKLGGLGGGMPHHKEYREAIIERLSGK